MSNKENKINIGLDIGVSSVGWSVIDDDYNIIDMGVRLFDDPADEKDGKLRNITRRTARHIRRLYSRRKIRINDLCNLLIKYHYVINKDEFKEKIKIDITKFNNCNNPIELKCRALKQKISKDELIYILFHYINHRGYFYLTDEDQKQINKNKTNQINKTNIYPSNRLFDFYKKHDYYKNASCFKDNKLLNSDLYFSNIDWQNEIKKLLYNQDCSNQFIDDYLAIFTRIRKFNEGPGGEKSPTPYGLYWIDPITKKTKKIGNNLWDITIGKCSYYRDLDRGFKNSPIAELFNFFNDISNIRFKKEPYHITAEMMDQIINDINKIFPNRTFNFTLEKFVKLHNKFCKNNEIIEIDDINGYRKNSKKKFLFSTLANYKIIAKYLHDNYDKLKKDYQYDNKDICSINNISLLEKSNLFFNNIARNTSDVCSRLNWLKQEHKTVDEKQNQDLVDNLVGLSQTSSLSDQAMLKYIKYFIDYKPKNDDCFYDNWIAYAYKNKPYEQNVVHKSTYLPSNLMDNEIISPTVRRSFNQTCQIVNKIISIYCKNNKNPNNQKYKINNITIELPRDKNTADQRKKIKKFQDANEEINKEAKSKHVSNERFKLWKLQRGKDLYDGSDIDIKSSGLQVDHIIPLSISSDNSLSNKVLTTIQNNQNKGQNTPHQWLSKNGKFGIYKERIERWWKELTDDEKYQNKKKYEYLLYMKDPLDNIYDFTDKLVDTRYASRLVLNKFQDFFKSNDIYGRVKIKVVRGTITRLCRENLFYDDNKKMTFLPKDRNLYCHHAIDASLICFLGMNKIFHKLIDDCDYFIKTNRFARNENKQLINKSTGEIVDVMKLYDKNKDVMIFGKELAKYNDKIEILNGNDKNGTKQYKFVPAEKKVHFSRKLISKNNTQLSNTTIYSLKYNQINKSYQMIAKIDLIDSKTKDLDEFFNPENPKFNKKSKSLLIFNKDKRLYDMLQKIFNRYLIIKSDNSLRNNEQLTNDEKKVKLINPFIAYMNFEHKENKTNCIIVKNNQRVRKLRYIYHEYSCQNEKDIDKIIPGLILKSHQDSNSKPKSYGIVESLNAISWRVYKDLHNKLVVIPMNVKVLSWNYIKNCLTLNQTKLKEVLKNKEIINENDYIELKKGSILIDRFNINNIFYVNGYNSKNFEIKPINYRYEYYQMKINCKKCSQLFIPPTKLFKNYKLVQNDVLGKIYKDPNEKKLKIMLNNVL